MAYADVIIDNGDAGTSSTGSWTASGATDFYGTNSLYARPSATYTWAFDSQPAGEYEVLMWWSTTNTRGDSVEVTVNTSGGPVTVLTNQLVDGGQWNSLGTFSFDGAGSVMVTASNDRLNDGRYVSTCADAVWFRQVSGNLAPTAFIDSITPNPTGLGEEVVFTGHGEDSEGTVTAWSWDSDIDGNLSTAASFSTTSLSEGLHEISYTVQDDEGLWSTAATMSLRVGNPPIELILDNGDPGTSSTGTWSISSGPNPYGSSSLYARPTATYTWQFSSMEAGTYEVYMWWTYASSRGTAVPVDINGLETVTVNQRANGGQWNYLGTYIFDGSGYVTVTAVGTTSTCADAVRLVSVDLNAAPTASILSITPNPAASDATVSFVGEGVDGDGSILTYEWLSDLDGSLSNQASFDSGALSEGVHEISFRVQDNEGSWSPFVTAELIVGTPDPVATIDSIAPNPAGPDATVVFSGHGDAFGGATLSSYLWESDIDGTLGSEASISYGPLTVGTHTISFTVTDSNGEISAAVQQELVVEYPEIIIDNGDSGTSSTGTWSVSGGPNPYGSNSLYARPTATYTWQFASQPPGIYDVYMWWTYASSRGTEVPVDINGLETVTVNQQVGGGQWNYLGAYYFNGSGYVTITAVGTTSTCADAVRFEYVTGNLPPSAEILEITPNPADSGASISFSGQGTDSDGEIVGYSWESDVDGVLSDQASFNAVLSDGLHEIRFSVQDDEGSWSPVVSQSLEVGEVLYTMDYDNGENTTSTGQWLPSSRPDPYGGESLYSRDGATYTWHFTPPASADYIVNMWWTDYFNRSDSVPVEIVYEGGSQTVTVNQQINGGQWNELGQFPFMAGNSYTVTITAQPGPSSTSADAVQFVQVSDSQAPVADFSANPAGGVVPVLVEFTDTSTGEVDSWLWDFGDGTTSTDPAPTHEYTISGDYTVSLTVTNSFGSDTEEKIAYIQTAGSDTENIYVAVGWGATYGGIWREMEDEISAIGAVEISDDVWRYTNPVKGVTYYMHYIDTVAQFEAAIREPGSHVIYNGHSNYGLGLAFLGAGQQVDVRYFDDPLISNVSTDMVDPSIPGLRYGQAYPNWDPVYSWGESAIMPYDFDEGMPPYNYFATYTLPGDATHYRIEAADGSYIERFPDSGRPAWYSPEGLEPDPVLNPEYFITNPTDDWERCELAGNWESASPGDWHTATYYLGQNYQYHAPGTGSNSATFTLPVRIPGVYAVMATWYPDPSNATNATYTIQHTDIGAGEYDTVVVNQQESAVFNMLGAYYFDVGSYTVQLTDNADGNVVADVVALMYASDPQVVTKAEFSADQRTGAGPMTVQLIDRSTIYVNGNLDPSITYEWDFGDGTTSGARNPMHTFSGQGTYTVSLTVTDEIGNTDTEVKEDFIVVDDIAPLHAEFTAANGVMGSAGSASINFLNQSTGDITEYLWDFGDGTTSTERNPTHTYTGGGTFTVTLTVTGPGGTDSETEGDYIYSTVGAIFVDNTFDTKPHYYRNYSGTILGSTIMDASPVSLPNDEMRYSRFFFNGCVSEDYYLPKFTRGVVFYTMSNREELADPSAEYLVEYLLGGTNDEILQAINEVNYIHGYFDFNKLPPSMR